MAERCGRCTVSATAETSVKTLRAGFQVDIPTVIRAPGQSCLSLKSDPSPSVLSGVTCSIRAGPFSTTNCPISRYQRQFDISERRCRQTIGASCHIGNRSRFYRAVPTGAEAREALRVMEDHKSFDPVAVYSDVPNPTQL